MAQIQALVVRMATENRTWGYTRIQGALANLHHRVARGTIANILRRHGLEPAPEREEVDDVAGVLAGALGRPRGRGFLHG